MPFETVPCETCGKPTIHLGTKRCNGCWEVESRLGEYLKSPNGREFARKLLLEHRRSENFTAQADSVTRQSVDIAPKENVDEYALEAIQRKKDMYRRFYGG
jgi:hypothetical protein